MNEKMFLIRYGEIFLKSKPVFKMFYNILVNNIREQLNREKIDYQLSATRERIFIKTEKDNFEKTKEILKNIFGITSFSLVDYLETSDIEKIADFVQSNYQNFIKPEETFAIRVTRQGKHTYSSQDLASKIGGLINAKVDLSNPQKEIFIDVRNDQAFIYTEIIKGRGGLPVGASGKILVLISGGIDSPVASFLMNKRGCENIFLHFHSFPITSQRSQEKTREILNILKKFQPRIKIYFVPFADIQNYIKTTVEPKYRIILYRRSMIRIANKIAQSEKIKALVTGEALGQVSSQTLDNIYVINQASCLPILRPLIGFDKEEIIKLAKDIDTYNISIEQCEDTCTLFTPKHPATQAELETIQAIENKIKISAKEKQALLKMEKEII